jgi:hypothetical protein
MGLGSAFIAKEINVQAVGETIPTTFTDTDDKLRPVPQGF